MPLSSLLPAVLLAVLTAPGHRLDRARGGQPAGRGPNQKAAKHTGQDFVNRSTRPITHGVARPPLPPSGKPRTNIQMPPPQKVLPVVAGREKTPPRRFPLPPSAHPRRARGGCRDQSRLFPPRARSRPRRNPGRCRDRAHYRGTGGLGLHRSYPGLPSTRVRSSPGSAFSWRFKGQWPCRSSLPLAWKPGW